MPGCCGYITAWTCFPSDRTTAQRIDGLVQLVVHTNRAFGRPGGPQESSPVVLRGLSFESFSTPALKKNAVNR